MEGQRAEYKRDRNSVIAMLLADLDASVDSDDLKSSGSAILSFPTPLISHTLDDHITVPAMANLSVSSTFIAQNDIHHRDLYSLYDNPKSPSYAFTSSKIDHAAYLSLDDRFNSCLDSGSACRAEKFTRNGGEELREVITNGGDALGPGTNVDSVIDVVNGGVPLHVPEDVVNGGAVSASVTDGDLFPIRTRNLRNLTRSGDIFSDFLALSDFPNKLDMDSESLEQQESDILLGHPSARSSQSSASPFILSKFPLPYAEAVAYPDAPYAQEARLASAQVLIAWAAIRNLETFHWQFGCKTAFLRAKLEVHHPISARPFLGYRATTPDRVLRVFADLYGLR